MNTESFAPPALLAHIAWLRSCAPENSVERAAALLTTNDAPPEDELWAATALAAARFVNNQAHNHMGFVSHAMIGCADARRLAVGRPARTRRLLLIQSLHQVVADMHDITLSPFELLPARPACAATIEESVRRLRADVRFGEYLAVDHRFVGLHHAAPRTALIDLMLDIGLEGLVTDDHTLISPVLSLRLIDDLLGWDLGFDLLRWAPRYSASFRTDPAPYDRSVALRREFDLCAGPRTDAFQHDRVAPLAAHLLAAAPHDRPRLVARALADDACSPATIIAAAAHAACAMYLMVEPVPHTDYDAISREVAPIHIGNSLCALFEGLAHMQPPTRVLAALQAGSLLERGPSVISQEFEFVPFTPGPSFPDRRDVDALAGRSPEFLLDALSAALPAHDYRTATAAVAAWAALDAPAAPLLDRLTAEACTDDGTLLHNFKHLQSMITQFERSTLPERWHFLTQAVRFMAWYRGVSTSVYSRADAALGDVGASGV